VVGSKATFSLVVEAKLEKQLMCHIQNYVLVYSHSLEEVLASREERFAAATEMARLGR